MTRGETDPTVKPIEISRELIDWTAANAQRIDSGAMDARDALPLLADESLIDLGAPWNNDGGLVRQAAVLETLAQHSLSVPFALWGHRMVIEFLAFAGGRYAQSVLPGLRAGTTPGASAMAPGYKTLAGQGDLDLYITRTKDGKMYLSGNIAWASNLYDDAIVVAPAYGPDAVEQRVAHDGVIVAFPLSATGVQIGPDLDILAMRGTASTNVSLHNVEITTDQILTADFTDFLQRTRPTLSILQASLCLGLASASFQQAHANTTGVNDVLSREVKLAGEQLITTKHELFELAARVGTEQPPNPRDVLAMRLTAGQLAGQLATFELKTGGGKAFITTSDTNRRYREATFIPLQAPSETQLRWELSQA